MNKYIVVVAVAGVVERLDLSLLDRLRLIFVGAHLRIVSVELGIVVALGVRLVVPLALVLAVAMIVRNFELFGRDLLAVAGDFVVLDFDRDFVDVKDKRRLREKRRENNFRLV